MIMFPRMLTCLLFVQVAAVMCVNVQKSCYTPNSSLGQCVPYSRCSYLTMQLEQFGRQVPQEFQDYVKSSRCSGPNAGEIFVCCENSFIEDSTTTTTTTSLPSSTKNSQRTPDLGNQQVNERGLKVLEDIHCGEIKGPRISNANKTKLNEFPFMALLKYDDAQIWKCGGTLITKRFVITAAHCWIGQSKSPYAVRLGEHDYSTDKDCEKRGRRLVCNPPPVDYGIEELIAHSMYQKNEIHNDIGLIRLDREVKFDDHIKTVCLPIYAESLLQTDPEYIIAGWGTTEKSPASSLLLQATIPARKISYCQDIFKTYSITDHQICAGGGSNVDSCRGDSGGPLFLEALYKQNPRHVQFGIVSYGVPSCGKNSYPTVYTKIAPYLPWITDVIARYDA